jgi:hypothetical protein
MLSRMKDYFEQPLEVKMQDARGSHNYGWVHFHRSQLRFLLSVPDRSSYIPVGTEPGPKPETKDGYETLKAWYTLLQSPQPILETD